MSNTHNKKTIIVLSSILLVFAAVVCGILLYCRFDAADPLDCLPSGFLLFAQTASVGEALDPMLDLTVLDTVLAEPQFGAARETLLALRTSSLRNSRLFKAVSSRRIDAAVYEDGSFGAVIQMGMFSAVTRVSSVFSGFFQMEGLSHVQSAGKSHFEYRSGGVTLYIAAYKDALCVASDKALFEKMRAGGSLPFYSPRIAAQLRLPEESSFRVSADVPFLVRTMLAAGEGMDAEESSFIYELAETVLPLLDTGVLGTIHFGITDERVSFSAEVPFAENIAANAENPLAPLFAESSAVPALVSDLPADVQYYTLLNIGTLAELKESLFPLLQAAVDIEGLWQKADTASRITFGQDLEGLLLSWTGTEYAVIGMETNPAPVFAVQIADEAKRRQVFDHIFSSLIVRDNRSLLLDGVRIPRIEIPQFLDALLKGLGVNLLKPYYSVLNGYMFFSESAENIAALHVGSGSEHLLAASENWQLISQGQTADTSVSLFYNLEQSIPFFLRTDSLISAVLRQYTVGRCDVRMRDGALSVQVTAAAHGQSSMRSVPGFPVSSGGAVSSSLIRGAGSESQTLYYIADDARICAFNPVTGARASAVMDSAGWLAAAAEPVVKKKTGLVWGVSQKGSVYLLSEQLEIVEGFPVQLNGQPSAAPAAYKDSLLVPLAGGRLCRVAADGSFSVIVENLPGELKEAPAVCGDVIALYGKRLLGQLLLFQASQPDRQITEIPVARIAYGSPALLEYNGRLCVGFTTQSGSFAVWDVSGVMLPGFPVELGGVHYGNACASDGFFYLLSAEGIVSRVSVTGEVLQIQIPDMSAREPHLSTADYDGDGRQEVFVCGDANLIYGFSEQLELLNGFPIAGHGNPVFMDINGGRMECIVLSLDNSIAAWNMP